MQARIIRMRCNGLRRCWSSCLGQLTNQYPEDLKERFENHG